MNLCVSDGIMYTESNSPEVRDGKFCGVLRNHVHNRRFVPGCRIYAPREIEPKSGGDPDRYRIGVVHDFYEHASYYAVAEYVRAIWLNI